MEKIRGEEKRRRLPTEHTDEEDGKRERPRNTRKSTKKEEEKHGADLPSQSF
jgi:hypothetical protein